MCPLRRALVSLPLGLACRHALMSITMHVNRLSPHTHPSLLSHSLPVITHRIQNAMSSQQRSERAVALLRQRVAVPSSHYESR